MQTKKQSAVATLIEKMQQSGNVILLGFKGTSHQTMEGLRKKLLTGDGRLTVIKNTLFEKAVRKAAIQDKDLGKIVSAFPLKETTAVVFTKEWNDTLKAIAEFLKKETSMSFKTGLLDKTVYGDKALVQLATLPGRTEFMGKFAYLFKSPISRTVFAGKYPMMQIATILRRKAEKGA